MTATLGYPVLADCRSPKLRVFVEVGGIVQFIYRSLQRGHVDHPLSSTSTRFRNCAKIESTSSSDVPRRSSCSGMSPADIRKEVN